MTTERTEINLNVQPILEIPRDRRGRVRWSLLKSDEKVIFIRQEAQALLLNGGVLTRKTAPLIMAGAERFYPGGVNGLRVDLGQPVLKRGDGYWTPENTEAEVQQFFKEHNDFSVPLLTKAKKNSLATAVHKYPGGLTALREKLGLAPKYKPKSYWTPENIEAEARQFIDQNPNFTAQALLKADRADLAVAAVRKYPGGIRALKEKLGLPVARPHGYWKDPANIEAEARRFIASGKPLIQSALSRGKMSSLMFAIQNHYPGGLKQLRANLELESYRKPRGYWTPETIEQEALEFYQANGVLTQKTLIQGGKHNLNSAITENYPGAMRGLKEKLGVAGLNKPKGFWTETQIEVEALEFYIAEGILTQQALMNKKRFDLNIAINRKYPGGIRTLREKLGIGVKGEEVISADQANEQLRKLLEVV